MESIHRTVATCLTDDDHKETTPRCEYHLAELHALLVMILFRLP
jgi:hypothetical protein